MYVFCVGGAIENITITRLATALNSLRLPYGFATLIKLRVDALVPAESRPTLYSQQKEAKALLSVVLARLAYVTVCLLLTA